MKLAELLHHLEQFDGESQVVVRDFEDFIEDIDEVIYDPLTDCVILDSTKHDSEKE
jgi:hypothetical protein